jgi:hypothetical protein
MLVNVIVAILLGLGIAVGAWQHAILSGKAVALGTVTDLPASRGSKGGMTYGIVASFENDRHEPHQYRSGWKSSNPGCQVGDTIRIYYDRENPSDCGLCSFGIRYGFAFGCLWVGLSLLLGKAVWVLAANRFDQIYHP